MNTVLFLIWIKSYYLMQALIQRTSIDSVNNSHQPVRMQLKTSSYQKEISSCSKSACNQQFFVSKELVVVLCQISVCGNSINLTKSMHLEFSRQFIFRRTCLICVCVYICIYNLVYVQKYNAMISLFLNLLFCLT